MTDEKMDARLRTAGTQWRAANAIAVEPVKGRELNDERTTAGPPPRRKRSHWLRVGSALLVMAAVTTGVVACRGRSDPRPAGSVPSAPVEGTVWQLLDGPAGKNSTATLYLDGAGHLVADDACQVIGGNVRVGASRLTISDQVVRFKSCTDSVGETVFTSIDVKILNGTASYTIAGRELTISESGDSISLRVTSVPPPSLDIPTLVGANWELVAAKDGNGRPVKVTSKANVRIDDRGRLTAGDGCNKLTGTAVESAGGLRISHVSNTDLPCPFIPTVGPVDSVLAGTVKQIVSNGYLTLTKRGAGELVYRWAPDSPATTPGELTSTSWWLAAIAGTRAAGSPTLRIDSGGRLSGNDGCRSFTGTAQVRHGTAILRPTYGPPTPCTTSAADQASTIDSFLGGRQTVWAIRDGVLVVYGGGAQSYALQYRH